MRKEIVSQYKATLKMMIDIINRCPENLWKNDTEYENAYWRIAYHALFYAALYLSPSAETFIPWEKHKAGHHYLGSVTFDNNPIIIEIIYSKDELIEYAETIIKNCESAVNKIIDGDKSGFDWLPMNKVELHLYNVRHIQHHIGQLIERLHQIGIKGIRWVGIGVM